MGTSLSPRDSCGHGAVLRAGVTAQKSQGAEAGGKQGGSCHTLRGGAWVTWFLSRASSLAPWARALASWDKVPFCEQAKALVLRTAGG